MPLIIDIYCAVLTKSKTSECSCLLNCKLLFPDSRFRILTTEDSYKYYILPIFLSYFQFQKRKKKNTKSESHYLVSVILIR